MNEKYQILSPFDITNKVLGPYLFSSTSRETLGDKMEYYFQDHSFVPLFIQENYLKPQPSRLKNYEGPEKVVKELELMDSAASSISDGDLVDALIHGHVYPFLSFVRFIVGLRCFNALQARATLVTHASARCMFDSKTGIVHVWSRCPLWRKPGHIPSVHFLPLV